LEGAEVAIPQYAKVRVLSDRFASEGVSANTVGYVIELHEDESGTAYEIEVMDEQGHTRALVVAREPELAILLEDAPS